MKPLATRREQFAAGLHKGLGWNDTVMQWHSCPGSGGVTVLEVSQSRGDVALRDVV